MPLWTSLTASEPDWKLIAPVQSFPVTQRAGNAKQLKGFHELLRRHIRSEMWLLVNNGSACVCFVFYQATSKARATSAARLFNDTLQSVVSHVARFDAGARREVRELDGGHGGSV